MDKTYVQVHKDIFVHYAAPFFPFSFLSILEREFFGGPKEKTLKPHYLFSFLPSLHPTNHIPKKFSFLFSPQSFLSTLFHLQTNLGFSW